jgi:CheY-like chemotaxis protein
MRTSPRLLLVDDEPAVLSTYSAILEQHGYDVTAFRTAGEARSALDTNGFDLLLCDLSLERNQSGFDVIDYARGRDGNLHAILLTGYASDEITQRAARKNVEVLFKPVQIEELLATIARLLRREKAS